MKCMKLKPLNNLTIGHYIDLCKYLQDKDYCSIAQLMYNEDIDFHKQPYRLVIEAVDKFNEYNNYIHESYASLFNVEGDKDEEYYKKQNPEFISTDVVDEIEKKRQDDWNREYSWYNILFNSFCNEDPLKMDKALKLSVLRVFYHLSFLNSKN